MWTDGLNNPKQGKAFRVFFSDFIRVPEEYDDYKERVKTHRLLLNSDAEGRK